MVKLSDDAIVAKLRQTVLEFNTLVQDAAEDGVAITVSLTQNDRNTVRDGFPTPEIKIVNVVKKLDKPLVARL